LLQPVNNKRRVFLTSTRPGGDFVLRIAVLGLRPHGAQLQAAREDIRSAAQELVSQRDDPA